MVPVVTCRGRQIHRHTVEIIEMMGNKFSKCENVDLCKTFCSGKTHARKIQEPVEKPSTERRDPGKDCPPLDVVSHCPGGEGRRGKQRRSEERRKERRACVCVCTLDQFCG